MNRNYHTFVFIIALYIFGCLITHAQNANGYQGTINAEFSIGLTGYAKDFEYKSIGVAASYGKMINNSSFIGIGIKPNYAFSDDDFDGFFMPIYGEYKYQPIREAGVCGFGKARIGYSPFQKMGMYAHIGGGIIIYQKWELSCGLSYQFARFKETWYKETHKYDYHLIYATLSVGYRF